MSSTDFSSDSQPPESQDPVEDTQNVGVSAFPVGETANRVCSRCKQSKVLGEYYRKGTRHDSACRACVLKRKETSRKMLKLSRIASRVNRVALIEASPKNIFESPARDTTVDADCLDGLLRDLVWETILEP